MSVSHRTQRVRTSSALVASVLLVSTLASCSSDDSPAGTSATAPAALEDAVSIATELPGDDPGKNFTERIWYPVREGDPDPDQNWADLYMPDGDHAAGSVPLVVFIHGGAWHKGAPGVRRIAQDLADRGLAVYNVEYRDVSEGGGWPSTFTDVADALDYVPSLASRHPEISTDDETVVGHSAGAQLAAWAGTRGDLETGELGSDPRFTPGRVVSLAGPLDLVWAANNGDENIVKAMKGTPAELPEEYASIDPIQNINRHIPVVAVHGTNDTLVPLTNSEHYVAAVDRNGGHAKLVLLSDEDHVSFLKDASPHFSKILDIIHKTSTFSRDELHDKLDGGTTTLAEDGTR